MDLQHYLSLALILCVVHDALSRVPSLDDLVAADCPTDKPHKCLPHGVCYGKYHYCSSASKTAEPCISEKILQNPDSLKQLCQGIANGQNTTELMTRHPACNLKTDCFEEFGARFYATATKEDPEFPWWWIVIGILLFIAAAFAFLYVRKKAKKSKCEREQHRVLFNNNERDDVNVQTNNRMNESLLENGNQRQQSADPEPNDTGTELQQLVRRGDDTGIARNPPDTGRAPDPATIDINRDAPSGSVNNRNSNHSSGNSSASFGSEPPEEDQSSTFPNRTRREDHPAEVENRMQRGVHMPSSEPSGSAQLVTNRTEYHHTNNRRLE